jgi:galactonate dehydratase
MEITGVETTHAGSFLFVELQTDTGLTGVGESGTWGSQEAAAGAVDMFRRHLLGADPRRIEHLWQYLYRNCHFRGAAIMGALGAIDVALWDLLGKHRGVPVYDLLGSGGPVRDRVRAYAHVRGETTDVLIDRCEAAVEAGFTAVGHLNPLLDGSRDEPYFETHAGLLERAVDRVRRFRDTVGTDVDLCLELHRRLDPQQAIPLLRELAAFRPLFIEDPIRPDSVDAMAHVAARSPVPIATGERLLSVHEFETLLSRDAVQYVRPSVTAVGGLTHARKVAAVAEAHYADVVPHNPLGPVSTAACLHLAASVPNLPLQEFPFRPEVGAAPGHELLETELTLTDGFLEIPDGPGLGVSLDEAAVADLSFSPRTRPTRRHVDGSVVDQ